MFGSGGNFGGSPVAISLLGNNISELKAAKDELKVELLANSVLKDVSDNDPAGIKEIQIQYKKQHPHHDFRTPPKFKLKMKFSKAGKAAESADTKAT